MQIDESQKKQYIVLCCLIVVMLAFGVFKIVGKNTHAGSPAKKQVQAAKETGSKATEKTASVEQANSSVAIDITDAGSQAPRDPFEPQIDPQIEDQQPVQAQIGQPKVIRAQNIPFHIEPLPGQAFGSGSPSFGLAESSPSGQLRLTGIIEGAVNVAIIRGEGNARYIVREGQTIDGMYRVESISRVGVRLKSKDNQRTIVLQLGGNNAENGTRA